MTERHFTRPQRPSPPPPPGPTEWEIKEAAWAIVKDAKGMEQTGHAAAVRWARAVLGLDDK